jgi:DNA-binding transcriptional LysR family regulator
MISIAAADDGAPIYAHLRPMPELRHYGYFVEIARRGTFTAAAEALNVTQSTLSEQILQLERECGSQLFIRSRTGISLTPAGQYLLHQAEALLAKAAETREGLAGFRHGYQTRLNIAAVLGALQSWMPAALAEFTQLEPRVQLRVRNTGTVAEIMAAIIGEQLDLGIVSLPSGASPIYRQRDLSPVVLVDEELVVLAPPGHSLTQLAFVRQEDLRSEHLVTFPEDYNLRRITDDWFDRAGVAPIVAAETGTIEVIVALVSTGAGVAMVPRSLARRGIGGGLRILRLDPEGGPRRVMAAIRPPGGRQAELTSRLVELMRAHAAGAGQLEPAWAAPVPPQPENEA